ncbi:MAG: Uma2 family endonuclease [Gemmatimonadota bacterium]
MTRDPIGLEHLLTLEEFERLPEESDQRVELSRGRVVREPLPAAEHGWLARKLLREIDSHASRNGLGVAINDTGFLLSVDPPTVRRPDVAFIARDNLPATDLPAGLWPMAPDLAVEIVSPTNRKAEIEEKVSEYLEAGTRLVWLVEPRTRTLTVYRSAEDVHHLQEGDTLDGEDVLRGFRFPISELFQPYRPPGP